MDRLTRLRSGGMRHVLVGLGVAVSLIGPLTAAVGVGIVVSAVRMWRR